MKKISSLILVLTFIVSSVSCDVKVNGSSSSDTALVSVEASEQTKLTNHMTEKERSMVKVGKLTVFDHEMNNDEKIVPDDGIYFEIWSSNDWIEYYKHYRENYPDDKSMTDHDIEEALKDYSENPSPDMITNIYIGGEPVFTFGAEPQLGYDGGEITIQKQPPVSILTEENGDIDYIDENGDHLTEEEYNKIIDEFYAEKHELTFKNFEELKPYLHETIEKGAKNVQMPTPEMEDNYEKTVKAWEAVINNSYKTLPAGTMQKLVKAEQNSEKGWEIDHEKIMAIEPYVKEYNIYDEQLDTNFVVHVTLPPDYDPEKTYPSYVLTDAVWRFNNCADMRKAMEDGKADDVILVSIGYDYSIDGSNDEYRIKYFCDRCEDFLSFITDDLMPYLGEEYNIDNSNSTLFGHSLGGTFAHYAAFNSDKFDNQPFGNYIIGSPAFWSPGFLPYTDGDEFKREYGYFDRNDSFDKKLFICGGADEDPVYDAYYGENDSTLEGIQHLMERLESYGVTTAECKIYPDSQHYQFIPEMLVEVLEKYYPAS